MTPDAITELVRNAKETARQTFKEVVAVCQSDRNFRMSIPVQETDTDRVIVRCSEQAEKLAEIVSVLFKAHEHVIRECRNACLNGDCGVEWEMELKPCPDCAPWRDAIAKAQEIAGRE